jgi:sulfate adenylyltransferase
MSDLVSPHGGSRLVQLLVAESERAEALSHAQSLRRVPMTSRETSDVIMLGMGAYTPLDGFMGEADWRGVCGDMKLVSGVFWPIPITLSAETELADSIADGEEVALVDAETDTIMAIMTVAEKYRIDREFECSSVFATADSEHPGVAKVMAQGAVNLAGPVTVLSEGEYPETYKELYMRPAESRALFTKLGWTKVAAFQTRNPMHRSHEHLAKIALEVTDGVFVHQVLGKLKEGDIPADVRVAAINALVEGYFVPGSVIQAGYPIEMRYAGPREALLHAVLRQNFGCSHLIVGRDHAGVGSYYGPFDAQNIFDTLWEGALQTEPLKIDITFYCFKCGGMATAKTCPHGNDDRLMISGTRQRELLSNDEEVQREFSRPEVVAILRDHYRGSA